MALHDLGLPDHRPGHEGGRRPHRRARPEQRDIDEWGLHLYYNDESLVSRRGLNSRGYPRRDPANAFAADYAYTRGTLPQADDLFSRSSLLAIPPSLSEAAADRIVDAYRDAARRYGLEVRS